MRANMVFIFHTITNYLTEPPIATESFSPITPTLSIAAQTKTALHVQTSAPI